jgi:hypothetical protein
MKMQMLIFCGIADKSKKNCYWVWSWSWHLNPNRKPMANCWRRSNTMQTLLQNYHSVKGIICTSTTLGIVSIFSTDVVAADWFLCCLDHIWRDGFAMAWILQNYFQMQPSLQVDFVLLQNVGCYHGSQNPSVYDNWKQYPSSSENWK